LDANSFFNPKQFSNQRTSSLSTIAFCDDLINKNFSKTKNLVQESIVFTQNFKKFDLIFPYQEIPEETFDKKKLKGNDTFDFSQRNYFDLKIFKMKDVSFEFFKNYIIFTRDNFAPKLSKNATEFIKNAYAFLKISKNRLVHKNSSEPYRLKKLETIIKISEAFGKMRMAKEVNSLDALEAIRLVENSAI